MFPKDVSSENTLVPDVSSENTLVPCTGKPYPVYRTKYEVNNVAIIRMTPVLDIIIFVVYYLGTSEYAAGSMGSSASSFGLYPRRTWSKTECSGPHNMQGY